MLQESRRRYAGDTMLSVLCATKGDRKPEGLSYIPDEWDYRESHAFPWAVAANELLDGCEGDALFVDDDIELTADSFMLLDKYRDKADIIGFSLFAPTGGGIAFASG